MEDTQNNSEEQYQDRVFWLKILKEIYDVLIDDNPNMTGKEFYGQVLELIPVSFFKIYPVHNIQQQMELLTKEEFE